MSSCEVAAYIFAASIVSTADYGDIPVPRGYKSAISGAWAEYWRAAIDKELAGLIALRGTRASTTRRWKRASASPTMTAPRLILMRQTRWPLRNPSTWPWSVLSFGYPT